MQPSSKPAPQAPGETSRTRSGAATRFLNEHLWVEPLLAVVLLTLLGVWVHHALDAERKAGQDADTAVVAVWLDAQKANAQAAAQLPGVGPLVAELAGLDDRKADQGARAEALARLRTALRPWVSAHGYSGFVVLNRANVVIAATRDDRIGMPLADDTEGIASFVQGVLAGNEVVAGPFQVRPRFGDPAAVRTLFAAAPVRHQGNAVAVLALSIPPEQDVPLILQTARSGAGDGAEGLRWLTEHRAASADAGGGKAGEAFRDLKVLFWVLFGLLAVCGAVLFRFTTLAGRLRRLARRAEREVQQLGQYTLEEQIGGGGMGVVYRARHALLRRPTAVKLLVPERASAAASARFEREVQQTCRLTHPNTVAIYDYGRTPDGTFYYAMEYLDGVNLEVLVKKHGPLPDGRVIPILTQVCGSLAEAHDIGLIHRDVKPANIMLTRCGGLADFVKLLDFGLVKALQTGDQAALTAAGAITGTPEFLSPEAIERPEKLGPRSDLYALGAVAYFLLTGKTVVEGGNVMEVCQRQLNELPVPPSRRAAAPIAADLEAVVLRCLAKQPEDRPAGARELAAQLARCRPAVPWGAEDAEAWWKTQPVSPPTSELTFSTLAPFPKRTITFTTLDPNDVGDRRRKRRPG
jgi:serine/threonine protein kinase